MLLWEIQKVKSEFRLGYARTIRYRIEESNMRVQRHKIRLASLVTSHFLVPSLRTRKKFHLRSTSRDLSLAISSRGTKEIWDAVETDATSSENIARLLPSFPLHVLDFLLFLLPRTPSSSTALCPSFGVFLFAAVLLLLLLFLLVRWIMPCVVASCHVIKLHLFTMRRDCHRAFDSRGSARVSRRHFQPVAPATRSWLLLSTARSRAAAITRSSVILMLYLAISPIVSDFSIFFS